MSVSPTVDPNIVRASVGGRPEYAWIRKGSTLNPSPDRPPRRTAPDLAASEEAGDASSWAQDQVERYRRTDPTQPQMPSAAQIEGS